MLHIVIMSYIMTSGMFKVARSLAPSSRDHALSSYALVVRLRDFAADAGRVNVGGVNAGGVSASNNDKHSIRINIQTISNSKCQTGCVCCRRACLTRRAPETIPNTILNI